VAGKDDRTPLPQHSRDNHPSAEIHNLQNVKLQERGSICWSAKFQENANTKKGEEKIGKYVAAAF
jgi:hypothetical protein